MSICTDWMSDAPLASENSNANVCDAPLPELGVTDRGAGEEGGGTPPVTVHVPYCAQWLSCVAFRTSMYTLRAPVNPGLNVSGRVIVNVLPFRTAVAFEGCRMHWPFCSV